MLRAAGVLAWRGVVRVEGRGEGREARLSGTRWPPVGCATIITTVGHTSP